VEVTAEHGKGIADNLTDRGYSVKESSGENSGIHLIFVRSDSLDGAADMRREGTVKAIRHAPASDLNSTAQK